MLPILSTIDIAGPLDLRALAPYELEFEAMRYSRSTRKGQVMMLLSWLSVTLFNLFQIVRIFRFGYFEVFFQPSGGKEPQNWPSQCVWGGEM